jgi:fructose-1,6-bisphosphatase/inositol monophosphatase family enzyme
MGKVSAVWAYFKSHNLYMKSRIVYATCNFCHPGASSVMPETWAEMSESERKAHAHKSHWFVGKLDRLERHITSCPKADAEARDVGARLLAQRGGRMQHPRHSSSTAPCDAVAGPVGGDLSATIGGSAAADSAKGSDADGGAMRNTGTNDEAGRKSDKEEWLQVAKSAAREAGRRIVALRQPREHGVADLEVREKSGTTDLVTRADCVAQEVIFGKLKSAFPAHRFIGEEDEDSHVPLTDEATWIVDAIDGTTNYVHGLTDVAVCIALAVKRQAVIGVVFNPFRDEMFHSIRGRGAYLNGSPITASTRSSLSEAIVVCEWGYERSAGGIDAMLAGARRLMLANVRAIRQIVSGALDMCYVACGRVDAVYTGLAGESWHIWDYAAAGVIAEEAGALITDIRGRPFELTASSMACSCAGIARELIAALNAPSSQDTESSHGDRSQELAAFEAGKA